MKIDKWLDDTIPLEAELLRILHHPNEKYVNENFIFLLQEYTGEMLDILKRFHSNLTYEAIRSDQYCKEPDEDRYYLQIRLNQTERIVLYTNTYSAKNDICATPFYEHWVLSAYIEPIKQQLGIKVDSQAFNKKLFNFIKSIYSQKL